MIYIDGGHTYEEVYEDLISYYTLLKGPKVLCGDDYDWEGVNRAVKRFAKEIQVENIYNYGIFWILLLDERHI